MIPDVRFPNSDTCHQQANLLWIGPACGNNAHHATIEENRDPVRECQKLVQILGDEKGGSASRPLLPQRLVDRFSGANVDAAGGMDRNNQTGLTGKLAAKEKFLLVSA